MWLFTKYGFYSVVRARADAGRGEALDAELVMIRGRRLEEMRRLLDALPRLLSGHEIVTDGGTDYRYRLFVPEQTWRAVAAELASDIDYGNFKDEVQRVTGGDYAHALHHVWEIMYRHQQREKTPLS